MRRSVQEPFSKLVLIGSDDTASGESIELMMRSNGYAALLLTHLYSYDEIIETATWSGPDLVICYGSLHDEPAIKHLYGIRAPLIVISAHRRLLMVRACHVSSCSRHSTRTNLTPWLSGR